MGWNRGRRYKKSTDAPSGERRKYGNKKIETAEGVFDSKGEWQRWLFLKNEQAEGRIFNLRRQVKYTLVPTQYRQEVVHLKTKDKIVDRVAEREVTYTADFAYEKVVPHGESVEGVTVVEDFKGEKTDKYILKRKMMLYFHGVTIREVKKPTEPI